MSFERNQPSQRSTRPLVGSVISRTSRLMIQPGTSNAPTKTPQAMSCSNFSLPFRESFVPAGVFEVEDDGETDPAAEVRAVDD